MLKSSPTSSAGSPASTPGTGDPKSNRKYWGEECLSDAIYNVYLKKITYSTNGSFAPVSLFPDSGISSISSSSLETDLVDSLNRVFRRRSSFDKGFRDMKRSPKRNNRSASVSALLSHQNQQQSHHKSTSDFMNGSLLTSDYEDNIRIRNYQRLNNEVESEHSLRTTSSSPGHQTSSGGEAESSSLQWETRQIKILKAATIEHIVRYILFVTERQIELQSKHHQENSSSTDHCHSIVMDEERNNVSHVIHVLFIAYRLFTSPLQLFQLIRQTYVTHVHSQQAKLTKQFNFVLLYWLNSYPEDFLNDPPEPPPKILHPLVRPPSPSSSSRSNQSNSSIDDSSESHAKEPVSLAGGLVNNKSRAQEAQSGHRQRAETRVKTNDHKVIDVLLNTPDLEESIHRKALVLLQDYKADPYSSESDNGLNGVSRLLLKRRSGIPFVIVSSSSRYSNSPSFTLFAWNQSKNMASTSILDLDARFIAQQLTAIDLESFLSLKPYFLLEGTRSNLKVQATIKNFNLLSRQVILTILKSNA